MAVISLVQVQNIYLRAVSFLIRIFSHVVDSNIQTNSNQTSPDKNIVTYVVLYAACVYVVADEINIRL